MPILSQLQSQPGHSARCPEDGPVDEGVKQINSLLIILTHARTFVLFLFCADRADLSLYAK
jgi:hypothetical protein